MIIDKFQPQGMIYTNIAPVVVLNILIFSKDVIDLVSN